MLYDEPHADDAAGGHDLGRVGDEVDDRLEERLQEAVRPVPQLLGEVGHGDDQVIG